MSTTDDTVWAPLQQREKFIWNRTAHDVDYVLSGRTHDLPQKRSRIVRIFLSSTFTGDNFQSLVQSKRNNIALYTPL